MKIAFKLVVMLLAAICSLSFVESTFARGRYLHTTLGRYLTRDPLGDQTSLSITPNLRAFIPRETNKPNTGTIARATSKYVDGMNIYQYVRSRPTYYVDPLGNQATQPISPSPDQNFEYWYETQLADLGNWYNALPNCPCKLQTKCVITSELITVSRRVGINPDAAVWEDPSDRLIGRHSGAWRCIRSKSVNGSAQQCCYDANGELITHGTGGGTADRVAAGGISHIKEDVYWYDLALELDGGTPGAHVAKYLRVRPINNGNNCKKNP